MSKDKNGRKYFEELSFKAESLKAMIWKVFDIGYIFLVFVKIDFPFCVAFYKEL